MKNTVALALGIVFALSSCRKEDENPDYSYSGSGYVTFGKGVIISPSLYTCSGGRNTVYGTITGDDGHFWKLPAETKFTEGPFLNDLYNQCNSVTPANLTKVDTTTVPTIVIDDDGEVISGFIYGDNYFEMYVNGKLVGVDPVPYTPFNSCFVKFKAKKPVHYAFKLVDWEENPGLGTELNGGDPNHPGDGGFIAKFSDGTQTGANWYAQTFYISPLSSPSCVTESGSLRISESCSIPGSDQAYALHWEIPEDWYQPAYSFSSWPSATTYTTATVAPKEAYTNFSGAFGGAQFIWSNNLVLDNVVLLRYTRN